MILTIVGCGLCFFGLFGWTSGMVLGLFLITEDKLHFI